MRKFFFSLLMGLLCVPLNMSALTIDDLDGMTAATVVYGNDIMMKAIYCSFGGHFEKQGNKLYLKGFLGKYDMPVSISNGNQLVISCGNMAGTDRTFKSAQLSYDGYSNYGGTLMYSYGYTTSSNSSATSSAYNESDGMYIFRFDSYFMDDIQGSSADSNYNKGTIFSRVHIYAIPTNADAIEYSNGSVSDNYPMRLRIEGNNLLINNIANNGVTTYWTSDGSAITSHVRNYETATLNPSSKTFSIAPFVINMPTPYMINYGWSYANRKYDSSMGLYNNQLVSSGSTLAYWLIDKQTAVNNQTLSNKSNGNITGTYRTLDEPIHYNYLDEGWVTNGGRTMTYKPMEFTFNDMQIYSSYWEEIEASSDRTVVKLYEGEEITHNVSLTSGTIDVKLPKTITIPYTLAPIANTEYVQSYDLYIIPGNITSIADQTLNPTTGIDGAILLKSGMLPASQSLSETFINSEAAQTVANAGNATLFVKVNYIPGANLNPTFHSLAPVSANITASAIAAPTATVTVDGDVTSGPDYFFMNSASVKLSAPGASIYYTLDGSIPSTSSTLYKNSAIAIDQTTTVKAIAVKNGEESGVLALTIVKLGPSVPGGALDSNSMKMIVYENFSGMTQGSTPSAGTSNANSSYPAFDSSYNPKTSTLFNTNLLSAGILVRNCYQAKKTLEFFCTDVNNAPSDLYLGWFSGNNPVYVKVTAKNYYKSSSWFSTSYTNGALVLILDENGNAVKEQQINFSSNGQEITTTFVVTPGVARSRLLIRSGYASRPFVVSKIEIVATPLSTNVNVGVPTDVTYSYDEDSLDEFVISSYKAANTKMVEASIKNLMVTKQDVSSVNVINYNFTGMSSMTDESGTTQFSTDKTNPTIVGVHHKVANLPYAPGMSLYQPVAINGAVGFRYCPDAASNVGATGYAFAFELPDAESFDVLNDVYVTGKIAPQYTVLALNNSTGNYETVKNATLVAATTNSWNNNNGVSFNKSDITAKGLDPTKVRVVCQIVSNGLTTSNQYDDYYLYIRNFRVVAHNVPAGQTVNQLLNVQPSTDGNFVVAADIEGNDDVANNYFFTVRGIGFDDVKTWYYSNWYLENSQMIPVIYRPAPVFTGVKYNPTNEISTHQEYQNNSEYKGYILCTVTSDNVVVGLSQHNHPTENAIAACALAMDETGTVYNDDEVDVREFYIGGNETDGYYFWCREEGINKVLATDPDLDDLYLETKTQAVNNGHIYRCSIEFADKSKSQRRINRLNPGVTLPAATVSFSDNSMNLNSADDAFIASLDEGAPIYLFSSENWKTTGVESLGEIVAPYVSVDGRDIVINGTDAAAAVYTLAGVEVYFGYGRRIALEPGVYVVKVDDIVAKVAIK